MATVCTFRADSGSVPPFPHAANRKTVSLVVVVAVHICVVVVQIAIPGVARPRIRRTPPVSVVAHIVETAIIVAVATRHRN